MSCKFWMPQQHKWLHHSVASFFRLGFPKRAEDFIFFAVNDAAAFKKNLGQLIPLITTTAQVQQERKDICNHKDLNKPGLVKCLGINIAFAKQGLSKVNYRILVVGSNVGG